jgi:hypothetical protein
MGAMTSNHPAVPQIVHDLDQNDTQQVPHSGGVAWVASCACGEYTCKPRSSPESARKAVYRHIRSMFRRIETSLLIEHDAQSNPGTTLRSGLQAIIDMPGTVTKARLVALLAAHPE